SLVLTGYNEELPVPEQEYIIPSDEELNIAEVIVRCYDADKTNTLAMWVLRVRIL
ncbi:hypothetical protein HHI36_023193, partial [Cryptolaemus montrouzieri]